MAYGEVRVFGLDGIVHNVIVFRELRAGQIVDLCFVNPYRFVCVAASYEDIAVVSSDLEGSDSHEATIHLEFGHPDIVIGNSDFPIISDDGLLVAYPVGLVDELVERMNDQSNDDEMPYLNGTLGSQVIMVDIHRVAFCGGFRLTRDCPSLASGVRTS